MVMDPFPGTAQGETDLSGSENILGMRLHPTSYRDAAASVFRWAELGLSRYVCAATVHMVMETYDCELYRAKVNSADLITPDGMPLVWFLRASGHKGQGRVYGPDLTLEILEGAARQGIAVGFYGGRPEVLARFCKAAGARFPGLKVAYAESPPFRPPLEEERRRTIEAINGSGVRILLVGLGCPKQEQWMAEHCGKLGCVMLGVGAAFDFLAGTTPQAPRWMMGMGLEWLFRLMSEPRRLWKRYLKHNPRFVVLILLQLFGLRSFHPGASRRLPPAASPQAQAISMETQ
jgi:N-acetylglucosaminyldiphosphoundecaprenol N-acetyl-beta-D-mannosaminyltransferase